MKKLISIAGLYVYYNDTDDAYRHQLTDPRAKVIEDSEVVPTYRSGELAVSDVDEGIAQGRLKGFDLFSLASVHFWKHGIEFDYFDVGSNVGLNAVALGVFFKRCAGHSSMIHAFEPGDICELLAANIRINGLADQVMHNNFALSDTRGTADFYLTPQQSPAGSLIVEAGQRPGVIETRKVTVRVERLSNYLSLIDYRKRGMLLKIDTEGNDYKVIMGMPGLLERADTVLQIEFFPSILSSYIDPAQLLMKLDRFHMVNCGNRGTYVVEGDSKSITEYIAQIQRLEIPASDIFLIPKALVKAEELLSRMLAN